jgi:hypothetical protein
MSNQPANPQQELLDHISSVQHDLTSLQDDLRLNDLRQEVSSLTAEINALAPRFQHLRSLGYPFEKTLEEHITSLAQRWSMQQSSISLEIANQGGMLIASAAPLEIQVAQLAGYRGNPIMAGGLLPQAEAGIATLKSRIEAAKTNLRSAYQPFKDEKEPIANHLKDLEWSYGELAEACFKLLPTEALIMAVKAVWIRDHKENNEDPEGVLFLTDQRLLFEQKQEIATKKVLFITTEKKKIQQIACEVPASVIGTVTATKRGFLSHEDHIEILFDESSPIHYLHFHIDGQDCNAWTENLTSASTTYFDVDRAVPLDDAVVERVKAAPTQCPACGGAITQPVLRGMDSLTCPFCGKVMRL